MTKPKNKKPACLAKRESFLEGVMRRFDEKFGVFKFATGMEKVDSEQVKQFFRSTIEELLGDLEMKEQDYDFTDEQWERMEIYNQWDFDKGFNYAVRKFNKKLKELRGE